MIVLRAWARERPLIAINGLFLTTIVAGIFLSMLIPEGPSYYGPSLGLKMLSWDGRWYFDIAFNGYRWDPVNGVKYAHFQNTAFFPLYPLIENFILHFVKSLNPFVFIFPGLFFGLISNIAFFKLAAAIMSPTEARWATAFFALWPACCFLVMGYPTGLVNLLIILSIHNYIKDRFLASAFWCGLATSAAPTAIFVALGLCFCISYSWFRAGRSARSVPKLVVFGFLSIWGFLCYLVFSAIYINDPLAFERAQEAWALKESLGEHFELLLNPLWYLLTPYLFLKLLWHCYTHHFIKGENVFAEFDTIFQYFLGEFILFLGFFLFWLKRSQSPYRVLSVAGLIVFGGYLWCLATTSLYMLAGPRILYPGVMMLLLLSNPGRLNGFTRKICLLVTSCSIASLELALVISGYMVT